MTLESEIVGHARCPAVTTSVRASAANVVASAAPAQHEQVERKKSMARIAAQMIGARKPEKTAVELVEQEEKRREEEEHHDLAARRARGSR